LMVLKTALQTDCIAAIQAENKYAITGELLESFKTCKKSVVVMDNDTIGKNISKWLTDNHGFIHCNLPDEYLLEGLTDFSDLTWKYGIDKVVEHFKKKKILL
jgi:hypothetical protein